MVVPLQKSTVREKRIALSERRKAWKQTYSSNGDSIDSVFPTTPEGNSTKEPCRKDSDHAQGAKDTAVMNEEAENELSDDDLEEIAKLGFYPFSTKLCHGTVRLLNALEPDMRGWSGRGTC